MTVDRDADVDDLFMIPAAYASFSYYAFLSSVGEVNILAEIVKDTYKEVFNRSIAEVLLLLMPLE